jgi:hypothetical protein
LIALPVAVIGSNFRNVYSEMNKKDEMMKKYKQKISKIKLK